MTTRRGLLCAALFALSTSACFRDAAYSGLPPGKPSARVDDDWHHSVFWGLVDISGSYDLVEACPKGWAEVHTELGPAHAAVAFLTVGLYYPESVTVVCSAADDGLPQITQPK